MGLRGLDSPICFARHPTWRWDEKMETLTTLKAVKDLVTAISRKSMVTRSSLVELQALEEYVRSQGVRPIRATLLAELPLFVTTVVEEQLRRARAAAGRLPAGSESVEQAVRADFSLENRLLESWSALYHVYLRPELNLSLRRLTALLADRHRRTVQRRLSAGCELLALELARREGRARAARMARQLWRRVSLPEGGVVGIDSIVESLQAEMERARPGHVVAITGAPRIGKSTLAGAVAMAVGESRKVTFARASASADEEREWSDAEVLVVDDVADVEVATRLTTVVRRLGVPALLVVEPAVADLCHLPVVWVPPLGPDSAVGLARTYAKSLGCFELAGMTESQLRSLVAGAEGLPLGVRAIVAELRRFGIGMVSRGAVGVEQVLDSLASQIWADRLAGVTPHVERLLVALSDLHAVGHARWSADQLAALGELEAVRSAVHRGFVWRADTPPGVVYGLSPLVARVLRAGENQRRPAA